MESRGSWQEVGGQLGVPRLVWICSFSCSHMGSVIMFTMSFSPTCSDIKNILLHRCFRCQGLRAGSPRPLQGTSPTEGCRARDWATPPAPQRTCSLATPLPPSSKRSVRSFCGSLRNRAQYRASTADQPPLQVCQVSASRGSKTKRKSTEWVFVRVGSSISGQAAQRREQVATLEDAIKSRGQLVVLLLGWRFGDHFGSVIMYVLRAKSQHFTHKHTYTQTNQNTNLS